MAVHLQRFTDQLYCSASELRQCVRPRSSVRENPGECLWFTTDNRPVTSADMQDRAKAIRHRWDAIQAGAVSAASFQRFDNRNAIVSCLRGKHILMTGESTTRDLFWELSAAAGFKVDRSWCMNLPDKKTALGKAGFIDKPCTRVAEDSASGSRLTFQFVSKANSTREVEVTRELLAGRPPDAVFAYCFGYDWYPTLMSAGDPGAKPEPDAMGSACMQHLDQAVRSVAPKVRTFLLGPTFPPAWSLRTRIALSLTRSWRESFDPSIAPPASVATAPSTRPGEVVAATVTFVWLSAPHRAPSRRSSIDTTSWGLGGATLSTPQ